MTFDQIVYGLSGNDSNEKMTVSEIIRLIEILRQEYAPTVEMTKEQKQILDNYREPSLYDGDYAFNDFYDDTHGHRPPLRDTGLFDNITEKQLMQAWLHPETIKVVDE